MRIPFGVRILSYIFWIGFFFFSEIRQHLAGVSSRILVCFCCVLLGLPSPKRLQACPQGTLPAFQRLSFYTIITTCEKTYCDFPITVCVLQESKEFSLFCLLLYNWGLEDHWTQRNWKGASLSWEPSWQPQWVIFTVVSWLCVLEYCISDLTLRVPCFHWFLFFPGFLLYIRGPIT